MKKALIFIAALSLALNLSGQERFIFNPEWYEIDQADIDRAAAVINSEIRKPLAYPNPRAGARWFPQASLGLFMHWGIHSPLGAQPSWAMIKGYRWNGGWCPKEKYYGQALTFNPDYHPQEYLKAAKESGFNYAVLTARHHDGYSLWPSKYGFGVKQFAPGRDLVKEYVDACRESGLKVGLYFSPRDWMFPGDVGEGWFDEATRHNPKPQISDEDNLKNYMRFLGYVLTQIEELLTNYGKIDVLWLDGMGWDGIPDQRNEQVYSWIRSLQPDIVINDRWANVVDPDNPAGTSARVGDFTTPFECMKPTYRPSEWFEHCHIWTCGGGGWGYDRTQTFRPLSWFFEEYVASRSLGGNFLPNVGPDGEGAMSGAFYSKMDSLKVWMGHSGESLEGAGPTPGAQLANVPLTTRGKKVWYAHLLPDFKAQASILTGKRPKSVILLRTGEPVPYMFEGGAVLFKLPPQMRTPTDDVVKLSF